MSGLIRFIKLLGRLIRDCFIVLGVFLFLFVTLNILAIPIARPMISDSNDVFSNVDGPESAIGLEVYKRVFKTNDPTEAFARLHASPYFSMHPRLEFITTPVNNRFFHVGLEGARYEPGWDDRKVASLLRGQAPTVFAFGGSTMFGYSVGADETISYYMNQIFPQKTGTVTINFGGEAYNENLELDKLIYLLKSGYRPAQVFFLDGWNDLHLLARSNMRLQDKVIFHGFAVSRGKIAFTPGTAINEINYRKLFAESLPLYRAIFEKGGPISSTDIKLDRDAFIDGFDFREADYIFRNWAEFSDLHREKLKAELLQSYRENLDLLSALASHYGFKATVFYQPIGLFDSANPFVRASAKTAAGYRYLDEAFNAVRKEITEGRISMIDLNGTLSALNEDRYLDIAHYTPAANRLLAATIGDHLFH